MALRAYVADDWVGMAVNISIVRSGDGERMILRLGPGGDGRMNAQWERVEDPTLVQEPTMRLAEEDARVLLDALHEHFKGPADARHLRDDLDFERKRSEKMLDSILHQHDAMTDAARPRPAR